MMPSRKVLIIASGCVFFVLVSFFMRGAFSADERPTLFRAVLQSFSKNEGEAYPRFKIDTPDFPETSAKAYIAVYDSEIGEKVLVSKNSSMILPIASITKLTTAMVALNSSGALLAQFSTSTIGVGSKGRYGASDVLPVRELVKSMLVESDNDAARAICDNESSNFIDRMNSFTRYIGAPSSRFYNCTGLDGEWGGTNVSTAHDVIELLRALVRTRPELLSVISMPTAAVLNADGGTHHIAVSTYEFNAEKLPFPVVVGKTGQTDLAKQNLVLALQTPRGTLYVAVLGSDDRFGDMKKLVEYIHESFEW